MLYDSEWLFIKRNIYIYICIFTDSYFHTYYEYHYFLIIEKKLKDEEIKSV